MLKIAIQVNLVISDPIFGGGTIVIFTSLAIISYGASYVFFGLQLKKVKEFAGDVKKAVSDNLDDLKKQVLTSIENAKENTLTVEEVKEKFNSFKNSLNQ